MKKYFSLVLAMLMLLMTSLSAMAFDSFVEEGIDTETDYVLDGGVYSLGSEYEGVHENTNIVVDPSFESKADNATAGFNGGWQGAAFFVDVGSDAHSGNMVMKAPTTSASSSSTWVLNATNIVLKTGANWKENTSYHVSFWAKTDTVGATATLKAGTQWYTGGTRFFTADLTDEWQYFEGMNTVTASSDKLEFTFSGTSGANIYIDDLNIVELGDTTILRSSLDEYITDVPLNTESATFITNVPYNAQTLSNISINNEASISVTPGETAYKFYVSFTDIFEGYTYTLDLSGLKDDYGRSFANFTFTMEGEGPLPDVVLENYTKDPTFENTSHPAGADFLGQEVTVAAVEGAPSGTKVLKFPASNNTFAMFKAGDNVVVKSAFETVGGKSFYVSFYARTENDDGVNMSVSSGWYGSGQKINVLDITTEWQKFGGIMSFAEGETAVGLCFNVPNTTGGRTSALYMDDLYIEELIDFEILESSIDDYRHTLPVENQTITLISSLPVDEETLSSITVSGGVMSDVRLERDGRRIIIDLQNLLYDTEYTVNLSGVKDIYRQSIKTAQFNFETLPLITVEDIVFETEAGVITATTEIINNSVLEEDDMNIAFILVSYIGEMIDDADICIVPLDAGEGYEFETSINVSESSDSVVAYVLDWQNLTPVILPTTSVD